TEAYAKANHLWWDASMPEPVFTDVLELDLGTVQPALAGPRRPQDRVLLGQMKSMWRRDLVDAFGKSNNRETINVARWADEGGESARAKTPGQTMPAVNEMAAREGVQARLEGADAHGGLAGSGGAQVRDDGGVSIELDGRRFRLYHGDVVIPAITSCTNTSN